MSKKPDFIIYEISETETHPESGKPMWNKAGVGFTNKDGSVNLLLDGPNGGLKFTMMKRTKKAESTEGGGE